VHEAVGYDAGKQLNGRKRFTMVDTLGLLLGSRVMAASVGEREGGKQRLQAVKQQGKAVSRRQQLVGSIQVTRLSGGEMKAQGIA
jgi:putative transposase